MAQHRLLLITYHFGADGATGGFRWRSMAEHLAPLGWQIDVVTAPLPQAKSPGERHPARLGDLIEVQTPAWGRWLLRLLEWIRARRHALPPASAPDMRLAHDVQSVVDPSKVELWTPPAARSSLHRILLAIEGFATLVAEASWGWAAARAARRHARAKRPSVLAVSTPPHISSVAAASAAKRIGVPSIVDLRDPWVLGVDDNMRFHLDDFQLAVWTRAERYVLRTATMVVHNTDRARAVVVAALGGARRAKHVVVPNGYEAGFVASPPDTTVFRVSFTGWLHPVMDVRVLLAACGRLRKRHGLAPDAFEVCFMGTAPDFGGVPLAGLAGAYGLADVLSMRPRGSRVDAMRLQASSAVLCAIDYRHPMAVPMKFYDYAQMCGAMLLIGDQPSALADAGRRIGVPVFAVTDDAGIDAYLDAALKRWRDGDMVRPVDADAVFSRTVQATNMAAHLAALANISR